MLMLMRSNSFTGFSDSFAYMQALCSMLDWLQCQYHQLIVYTKN
jgi:hypothetical protein